MKLRFLPFLMLFIIGTVMAQESPYPLVSIHDIQYIDGVDTVGYVLSPFETNHDTVRIRGVIMIKTLVDPDTARIPVMWYGSAWGSYLQDTTQGQFWSGINIFQSDTSVANQSTNFDIMDNGYYVEVTGVVSHYGQANEFMPLVNPPTEIKILDNLERPAPIQLSVKDFMNNKQELNSAFKYSGMYVEIHDVRCGDPNFSNGQFNAYDDDGNYITIYPQSRYYRLDHLLPYSNYQTPGQGTFISTIRGIVTNYSSFEILPIYPDDIVIESVPPSFSNITRNPLKVGTNQEDTISVKVEGHTGNVTNVQIHYRIENEARVISDMIQSLDDSTVYYAIIPGISKDSTLVDYYFTAVDDSSLDSFTPSDTTNGNYFYEVTNGPLTIHDVQYSPFGSGLSSYNGYEVTVHGIVTADTSDINGNETGTASGPQVYIQDGTGPWSGIRIIGTEALDRKRGDDVTVTGIVNENFGITQLGTTGSGAGVTITVNATGQPLPEAQLISSAEIDDLPDASVEAEKWEGVLVKVANVVVTNENADGNPGPDEGTGGNRNYGDILIADTSNIDLRIDLEDGGMNQQYHNYWLSYLENRPIRVYKGSSFESITGICWYAFYHYKLIPRTNEDFTGFVVGVNNEKSATPYHFKLEQNYPNPFNPSTTIEYSIAKESMVSVKIFNILGQEVKTLVSENQAPGNYNIRFNANDLSSGIYFYSLRAGNYFQVKKMILLK